MNDVVIGAIRGHSWPQISAYANSLTRSGFTGTKLMFIYGGIQQATRDNLVRLGFQVRDWPRVPNAMCMVHDRFWCGADWLADHRPHRFAIWTDVRDVVFQTNPSTWLENNIGGDKIIVGSECLLIKKEPTNRKWVVDTFGADALEELGDEPVLNAGTIAGEAEAIQKLLFAVHDGCHRVRALGFAESGDKARDQVVTNAILRRSPFKEITRIPRLKEGFAAVCHAIGNPAFTELVDGPRPMLRNGLLLNEDGVPFSIVRSVRPQPSLERGHHREVPMKVIDAFMFFDELDLLEIRLHELDPLVDHFVIIEALERHGSAQGKPATLRDNWSRVKGFEHKIKYILLQKLEPTFAAGNTSSRRESFNRSSLMPGILSVSTSPDDAVIISDCDEIPRVGVIRDSLPLLAKGAHQLFFDMFYYNVNRYYGTYWNMPRLATVQQIQKVGGSNNIRCNFRPELSVGDAGWHFSYFGGLASIRNKSTSFYHAGDPPWLKFHRRSDREVAQDLAAGRSILDGSAKSDMVWRESNDPRLPAYYLNNSDKFRHFTDAHFKAENKGLL